MKRLIITTALKTFNADFKILTNLAIYFSLSTYRVLALLGVQRGPTILIRVGICILLWRIYPHVERY